MDLFNAAFLLATLVVVVVLAAIANRGQHTFREVLRCIFSDILFPFITYASIPIGFAEIVDRAVGPLSGLVYKIAFCVGLIPCMAVIVTFTHEGESDRQADSLRKDISDWKDQYADAKSELSRALSLMTYDQLVSLNGEPWAYNYARHHNVCGAPHSSESQAPEAQQSDTPQSAQ